MVAMPIWRSLPCRVTALDFCRIWETVCFSTTSCSSTRLRLKLDFLQKPALSAYLMLAAKDLKRKHGAKMFSCNFRLAVISHICINVKCGMVSHNFFQKFGAKVCGPRLSFLILSHTT